MPDVKQQNRRTLFVPATLSVLGMVAALQEAGTRIKSDQGVKRVARAERVLSDHEPRVLSVSVSSPAPSVHAVSSVETPDGGIRAFWFGGTREGAPDVAIWTSEFDGVSWKEARVVVDRKMIARGTRRYVRKLGNPVIHLAPDGRLHLYVVSVSLGGWSGSAINRVVLENPLSRGVEGVDRLVTTPVMNLGTLVRGAAHDSRGGEVLLPAYHEGIHKFPLILRVGPDGRVSHRKGVKVPGKLFQPWALIADCGNLEMFLRRGPGVSAEVHHAISAKEGAHWSPPEGLDLANPNAAVSAVRLDDGSYLMAANPHSRQRSELVLLRSEAATGPWQRVYEVDTAEREADERGFPKVEYSYPWLTIDRLGVVHLFYTWNRKEIRHLRIGQKQLLGAGGEG